jgi:hypothetical protein
MVYFTAIGNIFWIFGIFCGHFVIFFLALGIFYQKYLATLIQRPSHVQGVASHPGADFSYIFFHGKSLSAENSSEFVEKTIFQKFFRGKFNFSPNILWENFPRNFAPNFP